MSNAPAIDFTVPAIHELELTLKEKKPKNGSADWFHFKEFPNRAMLSLKNFQLNYKESNFEPGVKVWTRIEIRADGDSFVPWLLEFGGQPSDWPAAEPRGSQSAPSERKKGGGGGGYRSAPKSSDEIHSEAVGRIVAAAIQAAADYDGQEELIKTLSKAGVEAYKRGLQALQSTSTSNATTLGPGAAPGAS